MTEKLRNPDPVKDKEILEAWDFVMSKYDGELPKLFITDAPVQETLAYYDVTPDKGEIILINSNIPKQHCKFIIAHELGHHDRGFSEYQNIKYDLGSGSIAIMGVASVFIGWRVLCKKVSNFAADKKEEISKKLSLATWPVPILSAFGFLYMQSSITGKVNREEESQADKFAFNITSPEEGIKAFKWLEIVKKSGRTGDNSVSYIESFQKMVAEPGKFYGTTHPSLKDRIEAARAAASEKDAMQSQR